MGDSLEQDFERRNGGSPLRSSPDTALRRIPETETLGPFRASESWRVVTMRHQISAVLVVFGLAVVLAGAVSPAGADEQFVRVDGLVQWIGGGQMIVKADTGTSVGVDLTSVPQGEYAGLGVRDRVAVIGMVSPDGRHVIGTSVVRSARSR
jgi:hypothetical protein